MLITLGLVISLITYVQGQQDLNENVKVIQLASEILGQEREIILFSSPNISKAGDKLPTIYLLDGKVNFFLVCGLIANLERADLLPPLNLVGINTYDYDREYDLSTPAKSDDVWFKTGGTGNFQQFLVEEVIPLAEKELPAGGYRLLIGHSFGGSFGLHMLLNQPEVFQAAIFADPSLWWNDAELLPMIKESKSHLTDKRLYFSEAGQNKESLAYFNTVKTTLQSRDHKFENFPSENHVSTLPSSIFSGMKFCFNPFIELEALYQEEDLPIEKIKSLIEGLSEAYQTNIYPRSRPIASQARGMTKQGHPKEAIPILEYLRQFDPDNIMVLNYLGEAYQENKEFDKARPVYEHSLEIAKAQKSPMVRWIEKRLSEF